MLVDLVGDGEQVMLRAGPRDHRALRRVDTVARRVVRRVEHEHARPRRGGGLAQRGLVDREVGRAQGDDAGHGARLVDGAEHEGVERLEDDHLVPLVQEGQEDGRERLQPTRLCVCDESAACAGAGLSMRVSGREEAERLRGLGAKGREAEK